MLYAVPKLLFTDIVAAGQGMFPFVKEKNPKQPKKRKREKVVSVITSSTLGIHGKVLCYNFPDRYVNTTPLLPNPHFLPQKPNEGNKEPRL